MAGQRVKANAQKPTPSRVVRRLVGKLNRVQLAAESFFGLPLAFSRPGADGVHAVHEPRISKSSGGVDGFVLRFMSISRFVRPWLGSRKICPDSCHIQMGMRSASQIQALGAMLELRWKK